MNQEIRDHLTKEFPEVLIDKLLDHYSIIKENFLLERHEPSELNGGKFCEVVYRLIEYKLKKSFTPIDQHIPNLIGKLRNIENQPKDKLNESLRIHFPRVLISIYSIRNKRGVGHLDGDVSPNKMDSTVISSSTDWIMAELLRLYYVGDANIAQALINSLVETNYFLVHEVDDVKRVLNSRLGYKDSVLLLLSNEYPNWVEVDELIKWTEPSSRHYFIKNNLTDLHKDKFIEFDVEKMRCKIFPTGLRYVEKNYENWHEEVKLFINPN